jgi:hypothetical protein
MQHIVQLQCRTNSILSWRHFSLLLLSLCIQTSEYIQSSSHEKSDRQRSFRGVLDLIYSKGAEKGSVGMTYKRWVGIHCPHNDDDDEYALIFFGISNDDESEFTEWWWSAKWLFWNSIQDWKGFFGPRVIFGPLNQSVCFLVLQASSAVNEVKNRLLH